MVLECKVYSKARDFVQDAERFLKREPVQNSVLLGVLAQLEPFQAAIPENAFLALIRDDGQVRALVLQYSSWHGVHSAYADGMSDDDALAAFRLAVYEMRRKQVYVNASNGLASSAQLFAICCKEEGWASTYVQSLSQQIYRLGELMAPARVPGERVIVNKDDVAAYVDMYYAHGLEVWGEGDAPTREQCRESLEEFAGNRMLLAYHYKNHVMALCTAKVCADTVARITGLYTGVPYRQRGFGTMLAFVACRYLRDELSYDDVIVLADTANDTDNAVYIGLGFEPVCLYSTYSVSLK